MSSSPQQPREPERRGWGVNVGLVLWPSFLASCAGSLLFFAAVDPALLKDAGPRLFAGIDREAGYALGFIFFWVIGAVASALSVYLVRTERLVRRAARPEPP
jgi:hypothetical protein